MGIGGGGGYGGWRFGSRNLLFVVCVSCEPAQKSKKRLASRPLTLLMVTRKLRSKISRHSPLLFSPVLRGTPRVSRLIQGPCQHSGVRVAFRNAHQQRSGRGSRISDVGLVLLRLFWLVLLRILFNLLQNILALIDLGSFSPEMAIQFLKVSSIESSVTSDFRHCFRRDEGRFSFGKFAL